MGTFEDNNFKNLLPERQREIARQGGLASGRARKAKAEKTKAQQAYFSALLDNMWRTQFATPEEYKAFKHWKAERESRKARKKRK